eukprot:5827028-Alexandrium_andersonii.AAC.1
MSGWSRCHCVGPTSTSQVPWGGSGRYGAGMVPSVHGKTALASKGAPAGSPTGPAGGLASGRRGGGPMGTGGAGGGTA